MKNIKKILALTLCSSAMLIGCNKRQKITLEVANEFCLKNYSAITKECSQTDVNYNLTFKFNASEGEDEIKKYAQLIVGWYSLYSADSISFIPKDLIKINGDILTIKGSVPHKNNLIESTDEQRMLFYVQSLGVRKVTGDKVNSYIIEYTDTCYKDYDIYVANNNNIVITGTSKMGIQGVELPLFFPNSEDIFNNDGCYEKCTVKLAKGDKVKTNGKTMFNVVENSSITAKYTYF